MCTFERSSLICPTIQPEDAPLADAFGAIRGRSAIAAARGLHTSRGLLLRYALAWQTPQPMPDNKQRIPGIKSLYGPPQRQSTSHANAEHRNREEGKHANAPAYSTKAHELEDGDHQ
ncbi:hypothetical protein PIIN_10260 [Serendipita indica DSM 11827]|uniref:Uncharacterized protein n=1 Tax=Serendipita indica (strain DSM 11827) TaxID=1109443 RepID=G4TY72_SERID|nr:hypothetical protein PIIN_10260 [Serendipita indica DSM 11827]